jgi:hypothetical protein
VTLVAAPAGSGKTLLLTSWMSAGSPPGQVAWLSLDQGDNDPVRFWTYVLAALGRSGALPAGSGLKVLVPSAQDDDGLLPMLLHGLEELASPLVLVLDDVHELTQPRVLHGIELLVRHAPPQLRLVLSTRADPPLPLHRLLVSGQLTQIRGADLAFTVPEVDELLAGYDYRSRLADDDLAGDDRSLAGYLVAEVLERQPAELRSFLLRTCVVDELSGGLADALTGRDDGERTLAGWSGPTCSWWRSAPGVSGIAITRCSPSCCATSCGVRRPMRSRGFAGGRLPGTPTRDCRWRPSSRRPRCGTGATPPTSSSSMGSAAPCTARTGRSGTCWIGSRPTRPAWTRSSRC